MATKELFKINKRPNDDSSNDEEQKISQSTQSSEEMKDAEIKKEKKNIRKQDKRKKKKKKKNKNKSPSSMITQANSAEMWDAYQPKTKSANNENEHKNEAKLEKEEKKENTKTPDKGNNGKQKELSPWQQRKMEAEAKRKAMKQTLHNLRNHKCKFELKKDGITFWPTPGCKPSTEKLEEANADKLMQSLLEKTMCGELLCCSEIEMEVIKKSEICSFLEAALFAWSKHYPFRFKPDHIWLLILQGVVVHVDKNAEKLRDKYVLHDGTMQLKAQTSFDPSRKEWMGVVEKLVAEMDKNTVKDTCEMLECDFSTSTITDKLAAKITIMELCKNYFSFECSTQCGFPQITLDGTKDDWIKLKEKATKLLNEKVTKQFGEKWKKSLLPLLDRFIGAFDGKIDCLFWNSMIKRGHTAGSGRVSYYHGWINILFPFLKEKKMERKENRFNEPYSWHHSYVQQGLKYDGIHGYNATLYDGHGSDDVEDAGSAGDVEGPDVDDYPMGLAAAPVVLDGKNVKFLAGFIGYKQDEKTLEITPNVAWCIARAMTDEEFTEKFGWSPKEEEEYQRECQRERELYGADSDEDDDSSEQDD